MKWEVGSCGFRYRKATLLKTRWFDICVLKIMDGGHIGSHYDKERQLRINIDLPTEYTGGKFVCPDAYLNRCGVSVYRADKHRHQFKHVFKGEKYTISLGFYY